MPYQLESRGNAFDLKQASHEGPVATGTLSTGLEYQIVFSRSSAVQKGAHLILDFPAAGREPTAQEEGESLMALLEYARSITPDIRVGINLGAMRKNKTWHMHLILPGSQEEIDAAPRFVDSWIKSEPGKA